MNYKDKLEIMREITTVILKANEDGLWNCNVHAEVKNNAILKSVCGRGKTRASAVNDAWSMLTNIADDEYVVINAYGLERRSYRWKGKHWAVVQEKTELLAQ